MKTLLSLLFGACCLFSFTLKNDPASDLSYRLGNLVRSFAANANQSDCEYYFRKIDALQSEIDDAVNEGDGDLATLRRLQSKTKTFYDFAATLTRCKGTSHELGIQDFNSFIKETGLSPAFVKKNECVSVYRVNINGFYTFYAVNTGGAKMVKIVLKKGDKYNSSSSTHSFGIMCNSVEGFNQGEAQGSFSTIAITCSNMSSPYGVDCD